MLGMSVPCAVAPDPRFSWLALGCSRFPVKVLFLAHSLSHCRVGLQPARCFRERNQKQFLQFLHSSGLFPIPLCLTRPCPLFPACFPSQLQVSQVNGLSRSCPSASHSAQNVWCPSGHKDLDLAHGPGALKGSWVSGRGVWSQTSSCVWKCSEFFQGWFPEAPQPLSSMLVLPGWHLHT